MVNCVEFARRTYDAIDEVSYKPMSL